MPEVNENVFGKKLAKELTKRAWDKKYFAEKIGVSDTTVGRWLKGEIIPKPVQLRTIMEVLGMDLQELGLIEEETQQQESILEGIAEIFQKPDNASIVQQLQMILDYVAQIASQRHIAQPPHPPIKRTDDTVNVIQPSLTGQEAVIVRTNEKEYKFTWVGTRDISISEVISIETGNKIASWRYIQNGKEQREPHNFDMHLHVCEGQTIQYHPPILLTRLHIVHASPMVRCIPRSSL